MDEDLIEDIKNILFNASDEGDGSDFTIGQNSVSVTIYSRTGGANAIVLQQEVEIRERIEHVAVQNEIELNVIRTNWFSIDEYHYVNYIVFM